MRSEPAKTPLSGPRAPIRPPDKTYWELRLRPLIAALADAPGSHTLDAKVGPGRCRLVTDDAHLAECFRRNFPPAGGEGEPDAAVYVPTHLIDEAAMRRILGIDNREAVEEEVARFEEELKDPYYRMGLHPESREDPLKQAPTEVIRRTLHRPMAFWDPEERSLLLLGSNDYGEVRARGILGGLEAALSERIVVDPERKIERPDESYLLLHGGAFPCAGRGAMVFIGPEGGGKRTLLHGLARWRPDEPLLHSAAIIVRLGDRRVLVPEEMLFVGADLARIAPSLEEPISAGIVENPGAPGAPDPRGRALLGAADLSAGPASMEGSTVTDLVIVSRDYDETSLVKEITFKEAMGLLTSGQNAPVYDPDAIDVDGYGVLLARRGEPYFNPCIVQAEIDAAAGKFGEVDRKRIASYLHLAREGGVRLLLVNPRLPPPQTQFCVRKFLAGECEGVDILKARDAPDDLVWSLGLKKQSKPSEEGRREIDRLGHFREDQEAEVVAFLKGGSISELIAFAKGREGRDQAMGYSRADIDFFFKSGAHLGVEDLFE